MPDGTVKIVSAIDDTPAAKAGLKAGDIIIAMDGKPFRPDEGDTSAPLRGLRFFRNEEGGHWPPSSSILRL